MIVIFGFCLAAGGVFSGLATFWSVPPLFLGGTAAAGAFALINSASAISPARWGRAMMGWLRADDRRLQGGPVDVCGVPLLSRAVHGAAVQKRDAPGAMIATDLHHESDRILARAAWRLIPFMSLMYVVSFLDRVNISFAALRMNQDLGFSPQVYGFASGMFFFGYFLFEVPSNLMLQKVGARLWMCRICVSWGFLSMLTAFRARAGQLLRRALSAGRGGSRALSRHGALHDLLVSVGDTGAVHRAVSGGRAAGQCDRLADLQRACWA